MKFQITKSLGFAALFIAAANFAQADELLFQEKFESGNLDQWIGKSGAPHHGEIVTDPLNPTNHVLTFNGVNYAGDMFTAAPVDLSRPRRYVLSFDFMGIPGSVGNGGMIGVAAAPTSDSQQFWLGGSYPPALTTIPSVATILTVDGQWHHYEIDFTDLITTYGLTQPLLMFQDWFDFGSIPGDAFFDNISVVGGADILSILAQVPCEGPAPGKNWKNHGAYVSAVSKVVDTYLAANSITPEEAAQIMVLAGESDCGNKK